MIDRAPDRLRSALGGVLLLGIAGIATGPVRAEGPGLREGIAPIPEENRVPGGELGASTTLAYDNLLGDGTQYYAGQGGHEALDDLHGVEAGDLGAVTFRYYDPGSPGTSGAYVTVYANPGGLDAGATPVAGPVYVGGLVSGVVATAGASFPGIDPVGADLWVGVRFTSDTAGLVLHDTPSVGTSHDHYREEGNLFWFGGDPVANFSLRLELGVPVGIADPGPASGIGISAFPNPLATRARIAIECRDPGPLAVSVFDVRGRRVAILHEGSVPAGVATLEWDGRDAAGRRRPGGMYFLRAVTGNQSRTVRLVLLP